MADVTAQMDLETSWPVEAQYLMGQGIGYVRRFCTAGRRVLGPRR